MDRKILKVLLREALEGSELPSLSKREAKLTLIICKLAESL